MKRTLSGIALGLALLAPAAAPAHESPAKHGGVVRTANDLHFEMVIRGDDVILYVEDHGKPLPTVGMSGKLTVLRGSEKSEVVLQPAGENRLEAKGAKLGSGTKAVAVLTTAAKKTVTLRFAFK